jgi:hypothetical protein
MLTGTIARLPPDTSALGVACPPTFASKEKLNLDFSAILQDTLTVELWGQRWESLRERSARD